MAKKAYVGVDNNARNVKNIYVGVNGTARKVVKGYVGVNGVARLFWDGGGSKVYSWNYWKSTAYAVLVEWDTSSHDKTIKSDNKIAYYAVIKIKDQNNLEYYKCILISPDSDAVTYRRAYDGGGTQDVYAQGSLQDSNGVTWYYNGLGGSSFTPRTYTGYYLLNNITYNAYIGGVINTQPVLDLIDRIYAIPFNTDYQIGQTYNSLPATSLPDTLRKFIGVYLFRNIRFYSSHNSYRALSNNAEYIINNLSQKVNASNILQISMAEPELNDDFLSIDVQHTYESSAVGGTVDNITTSQGFTYVDFDGTSINADWDEIVDIDNGTISYDTISGYAIEKEVGLAIKSNYGVYKLFLTNLGIFL